MSGGDVGEWLDRGHGPLEASNASLAFDAEGTAAQMRPALLFASRSLACMVVVLLALACAAHMLSLQPPVLTAESALRSADVARQISAGEGLSTNVLTPRALSRGLPIDGSPYASGGPMHPMLLSFYTRLRGEGDLQVRLFTIVGYLVLVGGVIAIGSKLGGFTVGAVSGGLTAVNPALADAAVSGAPAIWSAAWFALGLALVLPARSAWRGDGRASASRAWWRLLSASLAGLAFGLAYLTETLTLPLALAGLGLCLARPEEDRGRAGLALVACFLLVALPWWLRNTLAVHHPFLVLDRWAMVAGAPGLPGDLALRDPASASSPYLTLLARPSLLLLRLRGELLGLIGVVPALLGLPTLAALACALLMRGSERGAVVFSATLAWALVGVLVWAAPVPFAALVVLPLAGPAMALAAPAIVAAAGAAAPLRRTLVVAALVGLLALPVLAAFTQQVGAPVGQPAVAASRIGAILPSDAVVITDAPALAAWRTDRPCVLLPARQRGLDALLAQLGGRPVVFFLTSAILSGGQREDLAPYQEMLVSEKPPEGFAEIPLGVSGVRAFARGVAVPEQSSSPANESGGGSQ